MRREGDDGEGGRPFAELAEELITVLGTRPRVLLDPALLSTISLELQLCGLSLPPAAAHIVGSEVWTSSDRKRRLHELRRELGLRGLPENELKGELEIIQVLHSRVAYTGARAGHGVRTELAIRAAEAAQLPEAAGVYLFLNPGGRPLYVGSGTNLRRRVLSYFGGQVALTREMRWLLDQCSRIEHQLLGTHVEAVVEEARLIELWRPRYNVQRRISTSAGWVRLDGSPEIEAASVACKPRSGAAHNLGPLATRKAAETLVDVLVCLWGIPRRGSRRKPSARDALTVEELLGMLDDPDAISARLRRRAAPIAAGCPPHRQVTLAALVAAAEREASEGGFRRFQEEDGDALVWRYDAGDGSVYLSLSRGFFPTASARVSLDRAEDLERALASLLCSEGTGQLAADPACAVTRRWLHARRGTPYLLRLGEGGAALAARIRATATERSEPDLGESDFVWS